MIDVKIWRLLVIDDDEEICKQVKDYLDDQRVGNYQEILKVETSTDFSQALQVIESQRFDLLIVDVRAGPHNGWENETEAGVKLIETIKTKRFMPIVFYTGLPGLVRDKETALIRVVDKTADVEGLLEVIQNIFATQLPLINRALVQHVENVQRDYMWGFVADNWNMFGDTADRVSLAYLLLRRLAMSLSDSGIEQLSQDIGGLNGTPTVEGKIHPMRYYILPPVVHDPLAGDLYYGQLGEREGYWVLLTPSCDLIHGKAERVLVAHCNLLTEQKEYIGWKQTKSNSKKGDLSILLKNNRERFYFLPGTLTLPDLIVDFQQLTTFQRDELECINRLASLDSPFVEALLARFTRYLGRLGTPDLDIDIIISKL